MSRNPDRDTIQFQDNKGIWDIDSENQFIKHLKELTEQVKQLSPNAFYYLFYVNLKYQKYTKD